MGGNMEWIKKHTDTVIILTSIASSMLWVNGKFNDIEKKFNELEKEMSIVKTILIIKNIMQAELAKVEEK